MFASACKRCLNQKGASYSKHYKTHERLAKVKHWVFVYCASDKLKMFLGYFLFILVVAIGK